MARSSKSKIMKEHEKLITLKDAKKWLLGRLSDGAKCPCCHQYAKMYKRKITGEMARALILLYRQDKQKPDEFIHLPSFLTQRKAGSSNMSSLLRHWGLLERQPGERDDGSWRTGYYKITERGIRFVKGSLWVQEHIYLYNQERYQSSKNSSVNIHGALGSKFNYRELMEQGTE